MSKLESSDLVAKFRELSKIPSLSAKITNNSPLNPPEDIAQKLAPLKLEWSNLAPFVKKALLWNAGLVRAGSDFDVVAQVYTKCGINATMANIAVSSTEFKSTNPSETTINCTGALRQHESSGLNVGKVAKCAINKIDVASSTISHSSMWSQSNLGNEEIPNPQILLHPWDEPPPTWLILSIHTSPNQDQIWGVCPTATYGITIPCVPYVETSAKWCKPASLKSMDDWLLELASAFAKPTTVPASASSSNSANASSGLSGGAIGGIVAGAVVVLLLIIAAICCVVRKKKNNRGDDEVLSLYELRPSSDDHPHHKANKYHHGTNNSNHNTTQTTGTGTNTSAKSRQSLQAQEIFTSSHTLNEFQRDPYLNSKRLPYGSIIMTRVLSKGAFGEVWLGFCDGQQVAVKKILDSKRFDERELEAFTEEIRLMATFNHPQIVNFIGFAWNTLQNLCAVTQYMQLGDLQMYLSKNKSLSWTIKAQIAIDVLRGVNYLHTLTPKIIHRDLKSKNVLISSQLRAKLSDFGISRDQTMEETMTAGVGTIYWTAPEVLMGHQYTEKMDIYSFGVILCELDTHDTPYANFKHDRAKNAINPMRLQPMQIIQQVTLHNLRPEPSESCPAAIKEIIALSFTSNYEIRPSAADLIEKLEAFQR